MLAVQLLIVCMFARRWRPKPGDTRRLEHPIVPIVQLQKIDMLPLGPTTATHSDPHVEAGPTEKLQDDCSQESDVRSDSGRPLID